MSAVSSVAAIFLGLLILLWPARPVAHDIPNDVTIHTLLKPDGQRLRLLVRVPLMAMRDMDYPKPRATTNTDLLDLARADATLRDAATLWVSDYLDLYENGDQLPAPTVVSVRAALQSDKSFASYDEAVAHLMGPRGCRNRPNSSGNKGCSTCCSSTRFSRIDRISRSSRWRARLPSMRLCVFSRRAASSAPTSSGDAGLVRLDPRWHQAALRFVGLGFFHILDGTDHLLFLLCLVIPFRRARALIPIVTSFTVAHSITLIASAYNYAPGALWFPPLIETLIAMSIVYMALENIVPAADREFAGTQKERSQCVLHLGLSAGGHAIRSCSVSSTDSGSRSASSTRCSSPARTC